MSSSNKHSTANAVAATGFVPTENELKFPPEMKTFKVISPVTENKEISANTNAVISTEDGIVIARVGKDGEILYDATKKLSKAQRENAAVELEKSSNKTVIVTIAPWLIGALRDGKTVNGEIR